MTGKDRLKSLESMLTNPFFCEGKEYAPPVKQGGESYHGGWAFESGMSKLYLTECVNTGQKAVLKMPKINVDDEEIFSEALRNEIKIMSAFTHKNSVEIYGSGNVEGIPYMIMEYLPSNVAPILDITAEELERVVDAMIEVADFACAFHGKGYVHNDLKPKNMRVAQYGAIKIIDFGISGKGGYPEYARVPGTVFGTIEFMAPEIIKGKGASVSSDIFSMGVTLYKLIAEGHPFGRFNGDTDLLMLSMESISDRHFVPISNVPQEINDVILDAVRGKKRHRHRSSEEFRERLVDARKSIRRFNYS